MSTTGGLDWEVTNGNVNWDGQRQMLYEYEVIDETAQVFRLDLEM